MKKKNDAPKMRNFGLSQTIDEILACFEARNSSAKILSLDCFDTLLWRRTTEPTDVFSELQHNILFKKHGITSAIRQNAEKKCRLQRSSIQGNREINIFEIYRHILPNASEELLHQLVDIEIQTEKNFLFPYEPMFRLLDSAKKRGLTTILVSDMYISAAQLKELVLCAASRFSLTVNIDAFYTSSDYRQSKKDLLFKTIATELDVDPKKILHFGDNPMADLHGPRKIGIESYHFNRFSSVQTTMLSQAAAMQKLMLKDHGESHALVSTLHASFSQIPHASEPLEQLGMYQLGPVLAQYAYWLNREVESLVQDGQKPRLAFMMRDGYLPHQIHSWLQQNGMVSADIPLVSFDVSRFAALALNFGSKEAIHQFLLQSRGTLNRDEMLRQMWGSDLDANDVQVPDSRAELKWEDFVSNVITSEFSTRVLQRSKQNQAHFVNYVRTKLGLQEGETLVLADLGYSGTIQDHITSLLEASSHVRVEGRYLLLRDSDRAPRSRKGFIDFRTFPVSGIELLLTQIQTLEQFCTNDNGSLIGYTEDGEPVFENVVIQDKQIQLKKQIQAAALQFIASSYQTQSRIWSEYGCSPEEAIGHLARFILKPSPREIVFYTYFNHDINNGTQRARWISSPIKTREMLTRGANFSFNCDVHKMIANDLNACDPSLVYQNFLLKRLGLRPNPSEHLDQFIKLKGLVLKNKSHSEIPVHSFRTYDGYKIAIVPKISEMTGIGINFGNHFSWVQFKNICLASERAVLMDPGWPVLKDMDPYSQIEGGTPHENGIIQFSDRNGFLFVDFSHPFSTLGPDTALAIIYRDISAQAEKS